MCQFYFLTKVCVTVEHVLFLRKKLKNN